MAWRHPLVRIEVSNRSGGLRPPKAKPEVGQLSVEDSTKSEAIRWRDKIGPVWQERRPAQTRCTAVGMSALQRVLRSPPATVQSTKLFVGCERLSITANAALLN